MFSAQIQYNNYNFYDFKFTELFINSNSPLPTHDLTNMISSTGNKINNRETVVADNSIDLPLSPPTNLHPVTPPIHPG